MKENKLKDKNNYYNQYDYYHELCKFLDSETCNKILTVITFILVIGLGCKYGDLLIEILEGLNKIYAFPALFLGGLIMFLPLYDLISINKGYRSLSAMPITIILKAIAYVVTKSIALLSGITKNIDLAVSNGNSNEKKEENSFEEKEQEQQKISENKTIHKVKPQKKYNTNEQITEKVSEILEMIDNVPDETKDDILLDTKRILVEVKKREVENKTSNSNELTKTPNGSNNNIVKVHKTKKRGKRRSR